MTLDQAKAHAAAVDKLQKATSSLPDLVEAFADAKRAEGAARSASTDALNRVNEAQRAIDAAMVELRKLSPHDTAWGHPDATIVARVPR